MNNKNTGNNFERDFANLLYNRGWWVYVLPTKQGQPCDIIAIRGNETALIDCKVCHGNKFNLSRIEENQKNAAELLKTRSPESDYYFAIKVNDVVFMVMYEKLKNYMASAESKSFVDNDWLDDNAEGAYLL